MKERKSYAELEPVKKKLCLERFCNYYNNVRKEKKDSKDLDSCITCFQKKVKEGPDYICSVCNRILYRKNVKELQKSNYDIQHLFTGKKSFDGKEYICKTCNSKLLKGCIPCQAVYNKLAIDEIPSELKDVWKNLNRFL